MSAISVNKINALVNNVDPETLLFSLIKYIKPEVFIHPYKVGLTLTMQLSGGHQGGAHCEHGK